MLVVFGVVIAFIALALPTHFGEVAPMSARVGPFDPKPIIMVAIIVVLLIILLGSVWTMLRSSNANTIQAASDLTKVLVGFFVGVATKFLGT